MKNPVARFDAIDKACVYRVKYRSFNGIIPNAVLTDHTLVTFHDAIGVTSRKTIIGELWVERLAYEWIATSSPKFATEWPGFHKFTRGSSLMKFFLWLPC